MIAGILEPRIALSGRRAYLWLSDDRNRYLKFPKKSMGEFSKQESGVAGEKKSIALLSDDFWLLVRSVDVAAVDLIVQKKFDSTEQALSSRGPLNEYAFVQSKQFARGGYAKIDAKYVESDIGVRPGFFILVHSFDIEGEPIHWLFTSEEVLTTWTTSADKTQYHFRPTKKNYFADFARRTRSDIREIIVSGMRNLKSHVAELIAADFFEIHSNVRLLEQRCGHYLLTKVHGCACVLYRPIEANALPLDFRRDVFRYSGYFEWGYPGTGPRFLANSLLAHFFGGRWPRKDEVDNIIDYLIRDLNKEADHTVDAIMIMNALAGIYHDVNESEMDEHQKIQLAAARQRYAKFL